MGYRGVYHRARIRATRWLHPSYKATCSIRPTAQPILPDGQFAHIRHAKTARRAILPQAASIDLARKSAAHIPVPHPIRGALRDRHERWERDAMDAGDVN